MTDGNAVPIGGLVTAGQTHDSKNFEDALDAALIPQEGPGRPRGRPVALAGDKAYSMHRIRRWLHARKIEPAIPQRSNQVGRNGRNRTFDSTECRERTVVERCVGWLTECRGVGTGFERLTANPAAMVDRAIIQRLLRVAGRQGPLG